MTTRWIVAALLVTACATTAPTVTETARAIDRLRVEAWNAAIEKCAELTEQEVIVPGPVGAKQLRMLKAEAP